MNLAARGSASDRSPWDRPHPLDCLFAAKSVAVVEATEQPGSMGRTVLWNLLSTPFGGAVFPVNAERSSVLGIRAYPALSHLPEKPDLVVVTSPAATVPGLIRQAAELGIPGVVILSAGFKESGPAGLALEREVLAAVRPSGPRLLGPNCLGVMNPITGVNATFAAGMARRGSVAFLSQSGAFCTAVLDWSIKEMVGFSAFVSVGSMLDIGWGDLISYFGNDPSTKSIVIYMESIGDARSFVSVAREVALTKPIIVIKPGRTAGAAKAAASHTGSLTGCDEVLDAAFKRCGVLRVHNMSDLFYMAEVLASQPCPKGNRLTLITNAGGPGVLATDALLLHGGQLAQLAPQTVQALAQLLPPGASPSNPVDLLDDANAERYARCLEIAGRDPDSDGLLVILTPQAMTEAAATAEQLKAFGHLEGKPVLASWMGGSEVAAGEAILNRAGIPTFPYPDTAARIFTQMWRYADNLRALYETPNDTGDDDLTAGTAKAGALLARLRDQRRTLLTEFESKELLSAYGIPVVPTQCAYTAAEAVSWAEAMGYPCVLKLLSESLPHKSEVEGVRLNLPDAAAVELAFREILAAVSRRAGPEHFQGVTVQKMVPLERGYELILGSSLDAQFGPVLLFGLGGRLVEVFQDHALGLPPLNTTLARRLMEQTRLYPLLQGARGRPAVDLAALEQTLVRFSRLAAEQPWIREMDVNPLLAGPDGVLALDARIILHGPEVTADQLPTLAIRPYPTAYVVERTLKDGTPVTFRPIRPEDEPLMVQFHEGLSENSVYSRYFHKLSLSQRVSHNRLVRICFNDYDREIALVAVVRKDGVRRIIGVGRLSKLHGLNQAEFALLISDDWQNQGLGTSLLQLLIEAARHEKLAKLVTCILADNRHMQHLCKKYGFVIQRQTGESECTGELVL